MTQNRVMMEKIVKKFEPGDVLLCIDSAAWADHVTENTLYVVKDYVRFTERGWIIMLVEDDTGRPYTAFEDRFEKVGHII